MDKYKFIAALCGHVGLTYREPAAAGSRHLRYGRQRRGSVQRRVSDSAKSWRLLQVVPAVLILILSVPSGGLIVHISSTHLLLYALIIY